MAPVVADRPHVIWSNGKVCSKLVAALEGHVHGRVLASDSGVAYFSYERLPKEVTPRVYPEVSPELVFEVMSPDDVFQDVIAKVDEYLAAGVQLVFVIDPSREQAMLFEKGKLGTLFGPADEMTFPGVLPDLRIPVGPLFK